jgi:hypothetical protein
MSVLLSGLEMAVKYARHAEGQNMAAWVVVRSGNLPHTEVVALGLAVAVLWLVPWAA